jgi:hypothetical protein
MGLAPHKALAGKRTILSQGQSPVKLSHFGDYYLVKIPEDLIGNLTTNDEEEGCCFTFGVGMTASFCG